MSCCWLSLQGSGVSSSLERGTRALMLPETHPLGELGKSSLRIYEVSIFVYLLSPKFYFFASLLPHS